MDNQSLAVTGIIGGLTAGVVAAILFWPQPAQPTPVVSPSAAWLDRIAPPGSQEQMTLLPMLMQQSHYHAQMQATGQSPDNCGQVSRAIARFDWP